MTDPRDAARAANNAATTSRVDNGVRRTGTSGVYGHLPYWERPGYVAPTSTHANGTGAGSGQARNDVSAGHMLDIYSPDRFGNQTASFGTGNPWEGNAWQAIINREDNHIRAYDGYLAGLFPGGQNSRNPLYSPPGGNPNQNTNRSWSGGGGYSEAEENAIWENYYKRYLEMIAGYDAPDVGERPVDDLTDLIVARDVGARPEDVYTPLIKRRDVGDRPEDQWSSVIRETGDESLARSRSNWGSVAPMTANAFASAGGGRTAAPTVGAYGGGLMAGQGMDAASVRENRVRHQSDLDAGASNWGDLFRSNAAIVDQANANRNADVGTLGANSLDNINAEMAVALRRAGLLHDENVDTWERAGVAADNDFAAEVAASQARHQREIADWEQEGRDAIHEQTLARIASQDRHQTEVDEWEQAGLAAKNGHNDFLRSSGLSLLQQMMSAGIDVSKLNIPDWLVGV